MCALEAPSLACATCCRPDPLASRTQNETELSTSGFGSAFTATWNWPDVFVMRRPLLPLWAAAPTTLAVPLPRSPFQFDSEPDSKPSVKTTFV